MTGRRAEAAGPPARVLLRQLLGARLRRARRAQGRTLRDVAGAAGVSVGHLSPVERGRADASSEVLAALCRALGLPLAVLVRATALDLRAVEGASAGLASVQRLPVATPAATGPAGVRARAA